MPRGAVCGGSDAEEATTEVGRPGLRAQQKYMHEFHADRDHAVCNIHNRFIPVVQLKVLQKLSTKSF
jgi:hypothetical protein